MPGAAEILASLTIAANDWRALAIVWHVALGTAAVAVVAGWRPTARQLTARVALLLASVAFVSLAAGNPFNAIVFGVLASTAAREVRSARTEAVARSASPLAAAGLALAAFGWVYPHFLNADHWSAYLYQAPLGLIPCPTLSAAIGITMLQASPVPRTSRALAFAGLLYGSIGVFYLCVLIDAVLLAGALALVLTTWPALTAGRGVRTVRTGSARPPC